MNNNAHLSVGIPPSLRYDEFSVNILGFFDICKQVGFNSCPVEGKAQLTSFSVKITGIYDPLMEVMFHRYLVEGKARHTGTSVNITRSFHVFELVIFHGYLIESSPYWYIRHDSQVVLAFM